MSLEITFLAFVFFKYLSEKMHLYTDKLLKEDGVKYVDLDETSASGKEYLQAIKEEATGALGYFLKP